MADSFFVSMKRVIDSKYDFFTKVKIEYGTPGMRLNPYLIYLSRLEQMSFELTDKNIEAHGGSGRS